ncbi:GDP-L-fucose synthase [Fulvivirga kasyanovii]|uniref:GDP-L-fucose synthase n=1 Tax=Fulvivirga kasyanovii TaxID=396812 RepID=A0ABW9RK20_9BACT|nr:GDP-L-fucose synthase [Fulvivirga kasyanovii]MTI24306.1 GDP-L-fucose synthase [Fulvivirga kasyanovii]
MNKQDKIYVAGHTGMVGSAIVRRLEVEGFTSIIKRSSSELDLRNQSAVHDFFITERPDYVFLAAAKVGGILANDTYKADFIYDNLAIQTNVIHQSYKSGVKKLLFLGSSCVYPKHAPQPLKEEFLLTGALEPTNEPYAIAKIAGIKMCDAYRAQYGCDFISVMPPNLYGPNDNFDLNNSHVLAALMRRFHEAKLSGAPMVELWGTGSPMREFMHVDDLARACVFLMINYSESGFINAGTGKEISIYELALLIKKIVGYDGEIKFDHTKPDGTPRKIMDISRIESLGYHAKIRLTEGITNMYKQTYKS